VLLVLVVKSEEWLFIFLFFYFIFIVWVFGLNGGMWMTEHRGKTALFRNIGDDFDSKLLKFGQL
jgi:hypothetical protein